MEQRYNVYFAGEIIDGHEDRAVREALARLFRADDATLDKLFSGKAQLIKRECDRATAVKYQEAMERSGARALIRAAPPPAETASAAQTGPQSAAEKIAALAAAADVGTYAGPTQSPAELTGSDPTTSAGNGALKLCADGTEVLRPEERAAITQVDIDTSGLEVDLAAQRLSAEPSPPPTAPDTDHLSMGDVGETIPNLPSQTTPLAPATDGISLSPPGTDFSDCGPVDTAAPDLDLSAIELAPPETEVLREEERNHRAEPPPPDTDHIHLAD